MASSAFDSGYPAAEDADAMCAHTHADEMDTGNADDLAVVAAIVEDTRSFTQAVMRDADALSARVADTDVIPPVSLGLRQVVHTHTITHVYAPHGAHTQRAQQGAAAAQLVLVDACEIDLDDDGNVMDEADGAEAMENGAEAAQKPLEATRVCGSADVDAGREGADGDSSDAESESEVSVSSSSDSESSSAGAAAPAAGDAPGASGAAGAKGSRAGRKARMGADVAEDEEDGAPSVGVLKSQHELLPSALPVPALEWLVAPRDSELELTGTVMHVARSAINDPAALLGGDAYSNGGKGKSRGQRRVDPDAAADGESDGANPNQARVLSVVIAAAPGSRPLNEGSVVCLEDRRVLGKIEEIFGPVTSPLYLLRVRARENVDDDEITAHSVAATAASAASRLPGAAPAAEAAPVPARSSLAALASEYGGETEADREGSIATAPQPRSQRSQTLVRIADLQPQSAVYAVSALCKYVFPERIRAADPKGSDASNVYDEEIDDNEREFSDDEAEAAARATARAAKQRANTAHVSADMMAAQASLEGRSVQARAAPGKRRHDRSQAVTGSTPAGSGVTASAPIPAMSSIAAAPFAMPFGMPPASAMTMPAMPGLPGFSALWPLPPGPAQPAAASAAPPMPPPSPEAYAAMMQYQMQMQMAWHAHLQAQFAAQQSQPPSRQ